MSKLNYCIVSQEELVIDYYDHNSKLIKGETFDSVEDLKSEIDKIPKSIKIYD